MGMQFGEKLDRLFGQLTTQQSVPHHFDDTFFDKLIDYLPSDDLTNAAIAAFVSHVTTADACNLLVVRLCLRLCKTLVETNSPIVTQLPLEELLSRSQLVMHHDPAVREAFFNTSTSLLAVRQKQDEPTTQAAIQSLREPGESVFVRKSAQQYLSAHLRTTADQTTLSVLLQLLMQLPESTVLLNSAAAAVLEGNVQLPQQSCEPFVRIARTRRAVGDVYWRLTAHAIFRLCPMEGLRLLEDVNGWASEQGRLAVIKHLILLSHSVNGVVSQTTIDLLLDTAPSSSAIFHLSDVISILESHQLICAINKLIAKLGTVENVPTSGLTKLLSQLPAFVFNDNDLDLVNMFELVKRHCWTSPDLLRVFVESTPITRLGAALLETDSLVRDAVVKLDDSEWETRDSALELLLHVSEAYRRSGAAVPVALTNMVGNALSVAVNDESHFARASAVRLLESLDAVQALPVALRVATEDSDPLPRRAAVQLMRSQCHRPDSASLIAASLPRLNLDTDVEVLVACIQVCASLIQNDCEIDKAVAFLSAMLGDTDVNLTALDALKQLTASGRLSRQLLLAIDEAEMRRRLEFGRNHYAVQPTLLLDDMFAALCKDDSVDDEENMKDCY